MSRRPASARTRAPAFAFARARALAVIAALLPVGVAAQEMAPGAVRVVSVGAASVSGNYFATVRALCDVVDRIGPADLRCSPEPTPGSQYNLFALAQGEMDLALVQSDWQRLAVTGEGPFAARGPVAGLTAIAALYPEAVTLVARADAGIAGLGDLRGRAVDIGHRATARRATNARLLAALGVPRAEIDALAGLAGTAVRDALCSGRIEASLLVIGHPSATIAELLDACALTLVPIASPGVVGFLAASTDFSTYDIPAGTYPGQPEPVPTVSIMATLVALAGVEDDVVAAFVRVMLERHDEIARRASVLGQQDVARLAVAGLTAPLHPAAARAYAAAGVSVERAPD